jgi:hypothetical protein
MSEFGTGCTYNIGMFLAHADRYEKDKKINAARRIANDAFLPGINEDLWFNFAADHLFDLIIPVEWPAILKHRIEEWRDRVLEYGHWSNNRKERLTANDVYWSIQEAKHILFEIDRQILNIKVEKGEWE